jgi:hypothetical protein
MQNEKPNKSNFECDKCFYVTSVKSNWEKHITTKKHLDEVTDTHHVCGTCNKKYKDKSGLWRHDKVCTNVIAQPVNAEMAHLTSVIVGQTKVIEIISGQNKIIVEQNKELIEQNKELTEAVKHGIANNANQAHTTNTHTNSHNNSHNTHFNLQFFLNETCKDAINMTDFIKSIVIEISDLQKVQKLGYADGMSSIISTALDSLDTNKRPIHCSDLKRETVYIKEGNIWEKDNDERTNLKDMIRYVEHKNIKKINEWSKKNPECMKGDHKDNLAYLKMVNQVTGGDLQKSVEHVDKIIHHIAKNVAIDKRL